MQDAKRDVAPGVGELGGVVQEVGDQLHPAHPITLHHEAPRRQLQGASVVAPTKPALAYLQGGIDELRQIEPLLTQRDLAAAVRETSSRSSTRRTRWLTWRTMICRDVSPRLLSSLDRSPARISVVALPQLPRGRLHRC